MLINIKGANVAIDNMQLLQNVDFEVDENEFVYIIGRVGSGKSSLLKTLYGELPLTGNGEAHILDYDLYRLKRKNIPALRRQLGIIFQDFQLLSDRTVGENLDFVLRSTGWRKKKMRRQRIEEVLTDVGLADKADNFPHQLSGGEQQRISIARALLNTPKIILADEPTGNLDKESGEQVIELLREAAGKGTAVVMVTHNLNLLRQYPGVVYRCENGNISEVTTEYNQPLTIEDNN